MTKKKIIIQWPTQVFFSGSATVFALLTYQKKNKDITSKSYGLGRYNILWHCQFQKKFINQFQNSVR